MSDFLFFFKEALLKREEGGKVLNCPLGHLILAIALYFIFMHIINSDVFCYRTGCVPANEASLPYHVDLVISIFGFTYCLGKGVIDLIRNYRIIKKPYE